MILTDTKAAEVLSMGMDDTMNMDIDDSDKAVLMQILSEGLYSDPIGSTIREWASNALDSHKEAGVNEPILVEIVQDGFYTWNFKVHDFGVGISPERMEKVIRKYAASTKRQTNDQLGMYGLGLKSALSYSDSFIFTTRYNGTEYQYTMFKGEECTQIEKLYEKPTDERNGTCFQVQIKDWSDKNTFVEKCSEQLCYFDGVYFNVPGIQNDYKIYKGEDWKHSEINESEYLHISLDNVYYSLDFSKLDIAPVRLPVALSFGMADGLRPGPSREYLKLTPQAKELIKGKVKKVVDYFVTKYNESLTKAECLSEIYDKFENTDWQFEGLFTIDMEELAKHSDVPLAIPSINGVEKLDLQELVKPAKRDSLFSFAHISGEIYNGRFKGKTYESSPDLFRHFSRATPLIRVEERPKGVLMDYIKDTVRNCNFLFVNTKRSLGSLDRKKYSANHSYITLLGLRKYPKSEWRQMIQEFQKLEQKLIEKISDVSTIVPTEQWLTDRKANRKKGGRTSISKEEVNLKWAYIGNSGTVVFEKGDVASIDELSKAKCLYFYSGPDDKDLLKNIHLVGRWNSRVKAVLLSDRDVAKLDRNPIHNFIKADKFMESKSKPFKVFVTACLVEGLTYTHRQIFHNPSLVSTFNKELGEEIQKLKDYVRVNRAGYVTEEFKKMTVAYAAENNVWDESIYSDYQYVERELEKFKFVEPIAASIITSDIVKELVVDALKFRKIRLNLEYYTKPVIEEVVVEEPIEETEEIEEEIA